MVTFLQTTMDELVNMSWAVELVKSIGAANRRGWRVITSMVNVYTYQDTLCYVAELLFTDRTFIGREAGHHINESES